MDTGLESRRDPERLLKKASKEMKGKLTVFLGAAAGVGKTYAMLENAQERLSEGADIVIGWVEPHGRKETEALAVGLPRIAPRRMEYHGKVLDEMDIDAILTKHPEIVLVDELAHTNIAGSRHVRRFQDVEELLNAGIDVYTTLNIQHVESLNDVVERITQVTVRETVPDSILENADQVQLIDIPPADLIKRLKEGKVYIPGQVERALHNFFRPGNINALREMALRFTAHRVDQQLNEYMHDHAIEGPWPAAEKILVCVSASPFSAYLIRITKRMAAGMKADWYAVHVETSHRAVLGDQDRERLARNLHLADELGGKIMSISGRDMVEELLLFSHTENISHIVIGKPLKNRFWEWLTGGALVDNLIRKSGGIQIHVIQGKKSAEPIAKVETVTKSQPRCWKYYMGGLAMMGGLTVFCLFMKQLDLVNIAMLYLLPVLLSAAWWGRDPSYVTAVCTVVVFDYLFVPPIMSFSVLDIRYIWSFIIFLLVAFISGGQTERLRKEALFAQQQEKRIRALYEFSREMAALVDLEAIVERLAVKASQALERSVVVLLPNQGGKLEIRSSGNTDHCQTEFARDASEFAVASWVFEHGQVAGRSTETLPSAQFLYLPMNVRGKTIGVLGLHMVEKSVTPEQRRLIDAWATIAAIAVERIHLATEASQAALVAESERLGAALFNSISHELRTPLATIMGSASTLLDQEIHIPKEAQVELKENIKDSALRMERIINNLLDTARLESGVMNIKRDWCDMEDIMGVALQRLVERLKNRPTKVEIQGELPLIKGDCVLLEQVLVNLLDNAIKYSPADKLIELRAFVEDTKLVVSVADQGVGIPEEALEKVFEKFYRAGGSSIAGGTGLGLSICKGIIEAHGGTIWVVNLPTGGTRFTFMLPLNQSEVNIG
ncbi:two-component system sensor histidine kinase KdpD [Sporomusaceae bacterium BoRhaA]|uniref:sensor histidine kinase KdpD n=1 Tax=Pelorhabdus rhamnosifermentans TaxID=2772457 RepID=UPI0028ABC62F|nr:sensor histidine kinase KdpD [Pelorhabdus rhamnosifermentans]MBU2703751.1 two-component system sensor histidine kinase KdpD [Pelorhabdus rhamnosifermentans]